MTSPFIGEIRVFGGSRLPEGWALCNGDFVPISENETLFQLIGTTYGGDGQSTFALPDLRGRVPVHAGNGVQLGEAGGQETVTLSKDQMPKHTHLMVGSVNPATRNTVGQNIPASMPSAGTGSAYGSVEPFRPLQSGSIAPVGGGKAHTNIQPYLCFTFMISLFGYFPPPSEEEEK